MKILIILVLSVVLFGCFHESETEDNYEMMLSATDSFDQPATIFMQGETIKLNYSLTNTGERDLIILTGTGCLVRYEIIDLSGNYIGVVPRLCLTVLPTETPLKPGETINDTFLWDQTVLLPPYNIPIGGYNIKAIFPGFEKSVSIQINII